MFGPTEITELHNTRQLVTALRVSPIDRNFLASAAMAL